jgi:hypothetical protein
MILNKGRARSWKTGIMPNYLPSVKVLPGSPDDLNESSTVLKKSPLWADRESLKIRL